MKTTKRSPYDFYPTPHDCTQKIVNLILDHHFEPTYVFEPCAGDGAIVEVLRQYWSKAFIVANEINEVHRSQLEWVEWNYEGATSFKDVLKIPTEDFQLYDLIITNPPFSLAQEIIDHILTGVKDAPRQPIVVMLLRLNFLGSQKRHDWWQKHLPTSIQVLSKRPSFTGNGTDSQEYAWFVWDYGNKLWLPPIGVL